MVTILRNYLVPYKSCLRLVYFPLLQHCLLLMIDRWKKAVDSNKGFVAILIDLLKAFDCICHDNLVAKSHTYGLSLPALKIV